MSEPEPCFEPSQIPEGYSIDSYPSDPLYSYEPAYTTSVSCADGWSNELDSEPRIECLNENEPYTFSGCSLEEGGDDSGGEGGDDSGGEGGDDSGGEGGDDSGGEGGDDSGGEGGDDSEPLFCFEPDDTTGYLNLPNEPLYYGEPAPFIVSCSDGWMFSEDTEPTAICSEPNKPYILSGCSLEEEEISLDTLKCSTPENTDGYLNLPNKTLYYGEPEPFIVSCDTDNGWSFLEGTEPTAFCSEPNQPYILSGCELNLSDILNLPENNQEPEESIVETYDLKPLIEKNQCENIFEADSEDGFFTNNQYIKKPKFILIYGICIALLTSIVGELVNDIPIIRVIVIIIPIISLVIISYMINVSIKDNYNKVQKECSIMTAGAKLSQTIVRKNLGVYDENDMRNDFFRLVEETFNYGIKLPEEITCSTENILTESCLCGENICNPQNEEECSIPKPPIQYKDIFDNPEAILYYEEWKTDKSNKGVIQRICKFLNNDEECNGILPLYQRYNHHGTNEVNEIIGKYCVKNDDDSYECKLKTSCQETCNSGTCNENDICICEPLYYPQQLDGEPSDLSSEFCKYKMKPCDIDDCGGVEKSYDVEGYKWSEEDENKRRISDDKSCKCFCNNIMDDPTWTGNSNQTPCSQTLKEKINNDEDFQNMMNYSKSKCVYDNTCKKWVGDGLSPSPDFVCKKNHYMNWTEIPQDNTKLQVGTLGTGIMNEEECSSNDDITYSYPPCISEDTKKNIYLNCEECPTGTNNRWIWQKGRSNDWNDWDACDPIEEWCSDNISFTSTSITDFPNSTKLSDCLCNGEKKNEENSFEGINPKSYLDSDNSCQVCAEGSNKRGFIDFLKNDFIHPEYNQSESWDKGDCECSEYDNYYEIDGECVRCDISEGKQYNSTYGRCDCRPGYKEEGDTCIIKDYCENNSGYNKCNGTASRNNISSQLELNYQTSDPPDDVLDSFMNQMNCLNTDDSTDNCICPDGEIGGSEESIFKEKCLGCKDDTMIIKSQRNPDVVGSKSKNELISTEGGKYTPPYTFEKEYSFTCEPSSS